MTLLQEALEVHRRGSVEERRRWVVRHPVASSVPVCLVATALVTVLGLVVRPDAVTVQAVLVLFGASFGVSLLLLGLAGLRPEDPARR